MKLKVDRDYRDVKIALALKYVESYTLFDEDGEVVLANKEHKKKLVKQEMEGSPEEVYKSGEHHIQFGIRIP